MNELLTDLRNPINSKEIPENENQKKVVNIVEKIFNFNKKNKGIGFPLDLARVAKVSDRKCIKILTPKQMLQRSLIAFSQTKTAI